MDFERASVNCGAEGVVSLNDALAKALTDTTAGND